MTNETQHTVDLRQCQGHGAAGLGRVLSSKDDRDLDYPLPPPREFLRMQADALKVPVKEAVRRTQRYYMSLGEPLDQGATSQCVIYAGDKLLTSHSVVNRGFGTAAERTRIYKEVQKRDEWPGENYDGTSVRALMKWLREKGYIKEYRWAPSCDQVIEHILSGAGPVIMGTTWTYNMFQPDRWGYIRPDDDPEKPARLWDVAGGHAYLFLGGNEKRLDPYTGRRGAVRKLGSWGLGWGQRGKAWMNFDDVNKLIKDYGEACVPIELKKAA